MAIKLIINYRWYPLFGVKYREVNKPLFVDKYTVLVATIYCNYIQSRDGPLCCRQKVPVRVFQRYYLIGYVICVPFTGTANPFLHPVSVSNHSYLIPRLSSSRFRSSFTSSIVFPIV